MLQILIGAAAFMLVALAAVPYWRHRRISGVPGAYYLEQKFQVLVVDMWRDYKVSDAGSPGKRNDPDSVAQATANFLPFFFHAVRQGYDSELRVYVEDFSARKGREALCHAIAWLVIDHESRGDQTVARRAFAALLTRRDYPPTS